MASGQKPTAVRQVTPDRDLWLSTLGDVFTRIVLFGIEGTNARVVGVRGMSELLVGTTVSLVEQTPLRWSIEAASPIVGAGRSPSGEVMAGLLKLAVPRAFAVVPLVFGRKLAGLAYGDCGSQAMPLASVAEVFAACERLLNPRAGKSALPERVAFRSTARRDARVTRNPRADAGRRDAGTSVITLTDRVDDVPTNEHERPTTPLPPIDEPVMSAAVDSSATLASASDLAWSFKADPGLADILEPGEDAELDTPWSSVTEVGPPPTFDEAPGEPASPPPVFENDVEPPPFEEPFDDAAQPTGAAADALDETLHATELPPEPPLSKRLTEVVEALPAITLTAEDAIDSAAHTLVAEPTQVAAPTRIAKKTLEPSWPEESATEAEELAPFIANELVPRRNAPTIPTAEARDTTVTAPATQHRKRLVFVASAVAAFAACVFLFAPTGSGNLTERVVTLPANASSKAIGNALEDAGLVRSANAFTVVGGLTGVRDLRAGTYRVSTARWPWAVAFELRRGERDLLDVAIPEGLTLAGVGKRLEDAHIAQADTFVAAAHAPSLLQRFNIPGSDAQGWLAPGPYSMARGMGAQDVVSVMIERFKATLATLPETRDLDATQLNDVLVLASIVEREAKDKAEAPRIAGLFSNRLRLGMRLESRATALYILGTEKKELTVADVRQASPYNTYLNAGLPPGPIANPSLEALRATLHPEENTYYYMIDRDDGSGTHVFSTTYEEHLKAQRANR